MQFPKRRGQLLATVGLLAIVVGLLAYTVRAVSRMPVSTSSVSPLQPTS